MGRMTSKKPLPKGQSTSVSSLNPQTETLCVYKVVESICIFMGKISKMLLPLGNPLDGVDSHPSRLGQRASWESRTLSLNVAVCEANRDELVFLSQDGDGLEAGRDCQVR